MICHEPPIAGTVLRYSYLWSYEREAGLTIPSKDRPAALIVSKGPDRGTCVVLPITHREPEAPAVGIEIPETTRRRLRLDDERQWIILTDVNTFVWPGADLRPIPGSDPPTVIYGRLGRGLYIDVLAHLQTLIKAGRVKRGSR